MTHVIAANAEQVFSFEPIIGGSPQVLILGSMPGKASLDADQYYAHPRNAFWPMMGTVLGFDAQDGYAKRCQALIDAGVAVWDVLQTCVRSGSLDSEIQADGLATNHFSAFFDAYPSIKQVLLNGGKAYALYQKKVWPGLTPAQQSIPFIQMPSTSPANARLKIEQKIDYWRPHLPAKGTLSETNQGDRL